MTDLHVPVAEALVQLRQPLLDLDGVLVAPPDGRFDEDGAEIGL